MLQVQQDQIKRQQSILKHLGYYSGPIDGIWGPACIAAKIDWELSGKFNPAYPNGGLPFQDNSPYPEGIYLDEKRLLSMEGVDLTEIKIQSKEPPKKEPEKPKETNIIKTQPLDKNKEIKG